MIARKRLLPALLLSTFAGLGAGTAQSQTFSNVYVFGDSLSDAGYFRPFLSAVSLPAALVSTLGRFTTNPGPVWSELIVSRYGGTPNASNAGGTIYAQGGARVALSPGLTPPGSAERPVSTQITEYLGTGNTADRNALYTVWAGANDIFVNLGAFSAGAITQAQLQTNVLAAATAEIQQIGRLRAAGARYVVVFGLPDIGLTPQFSAADAATRGAVSALSAGYNTTLFTGLASAGIRVIPVDAAALLGEIRANASAYGFTNTTGVACGPFPPFTSGPFPSSQFCSPANLVAPGAATSYVFADGVHPTTGSHKIVADFVKSLIEGPVQLSMLSESALQMREAHVRSLMDAGANAMSAPVGKFTAFVAADDGNYDIEASRGNVGMDTRGRSLTIGVTARASENFVVGLAGSSGNNNASFGSGAGGYKAEERALTVFGGARAGGFYGQAALSIGGVEYGGLQRTVLLGQVTRVATSQPEGNNASFFGAAGYDFQLGSFTVGPLVAVASQNVEINAFDEAGAGAANLRIGAQKRRSEIWKLGVRASMKLGDWTPYLRVTAEEERRDDERFITATPLTMASGNSYDLPAYLPDTSFGTAQIGIRGRLTDWLSVGAMYYTMTGRSGIRQEGAAFSASFHF